MPISEPAGFFSYAHDDNENEDGNILELARGIEKQYAIVSAGRLNLFVDQNLSWGDLWRDRIDTAISGTTFFIPVITPTYFKRPECRRELIDFRGKAAQLGISSLLLPILYVDVDGLLEDSDDELKSLIAGTQYVDWRELKWLDKSDGAYRRALAGLAKRLYGIASEFDERQLPTIDHSLDPEDDDSAPGVIDLLAEGEEAVPRWIANLQNFTGLIQRIGEFAQDAAGRITKSDESGNGFAGRIRIFRSLAADLAGPADEAVLLGEEYSALLTAMDPAIRTLIEYSFSPQVEKTERNQIAEFLRQIEALSVRSHDNKESLSGFVDTFRGPAKMSKDLRPSFRKIEAGLRHVVDGDAVIQQWNLAIQQGRSE